MQPLTADTTLPLRRLVAALAGCGALAAGLAACGGDEQPARAGIGGAAATGQQLRGTVRIDGSSTVQPIAEAAAELFGEQAPDVRVTVGGAGTGDGFERFCRGETTIADASRAVEADELAACRKQGIVPVEVQVAIDGLSVVAHKDLAMPNDCISTRQLDRLLDPTSKIANFSELGAGFPTQAVSFFTPGTESGTYDYFTEAVLGTDGEQRTANVQTSADDNQIITGIEGTRGALGYVGFSFAASQKDRVKVLRVDGGRGCVAPTVATIADGSYEPLSRPLFMYASEKTIARPEVKAYIGFILENNRQVARAAGYVPLTDRLRAEARSSIEAGTGNVDAAKG